MATTDVLLIQPLSNLGGEGETVKVKAGYARNYLLPRKLAVPVTRANRKYVEALAAAREVREAKELEAAKGQAEKIEALMLSFPVKVGEGDKLFGSVTAQTILDKLNEEGFELPKKALKIEAVKTLGSQTTQLKLNGGVTATLKFEVVPEGGSEVLAEEGADTEASEETAEAEKAEA